MIGALAAIALMTSVQEPPAAAPRSQDPPVRLEDVTVTGRRLEELIESFVEEVAEPNAGRGLGRWDRSLCVGVANLRRETAQYVVDRVSTVAGDLGLAAGRPGCAPNLLVVATDDGGATARNLVERHTGMFRLGGAGMDRGSSALRDFQQTDRPVRWWQVSLPIDADTGDRAVRLPGDCQSPYCTARIGSVFGYAPLIRVSAASRLRTQIVDSIFRTIVIVDVDDVAGLTLQQLADYIAMVSMAQIDPDADASGYDSILNVFVDGAPTLTGWDLAYLEGLYRAERNAINRAAGRAEVEADIRRAHARARAAEGE